MNHVFVASDELKTKLNVHRDLSVIIPVFNQGHTIPSCLLKIKEILNSTSLDYELLIVNDGSNDNTFQVLKNEEMRDSRVKVISYETNRGKGYAVRTGVLHSSGSMVMFIDGDLEINANAILHYTKQLKDCDIVIASKKHPLSKVHVPISRRILSRAFNIIARLGTGIKLNDTQSGLKIGHGHAMRMMFSVMCVKRYAFDVEMLAIATMLTMRIKEMPVEIKLERRFKVREMIRMFKDVLAVAYRLRVSHWYKKQLSLQIEMFLQDNA